MPELSMLDELFACGAHYGYSRRRRHPSVNPYLYGFKNRTAIIELEATLAALARAQEFLKTIGQARQSVVLVGTKPEARQAVTAAGQRLGLPYVALRWIGGTLTNFSEIKKRLTRLAQLKEQFASGELEVHTKQERALFSKELARLEHIFSTITGLTALPAALVVIDSAEEKIAVSEARLLNLPVVALAGTDCDIRLVDYPIVANDASRHTIEWILNKLVEAYENGRTSAPLPTVAETKTEAKTTDDQH
ncbi:MAG: 30S ribosomal protein S2 [Patescibacteria group bacterium]